MTDFGDIEKKLILATVSEMFDKDKNGFLDKEEFRELLKTVNQMLEQQKTEAVPEEALDEIFAHVDANKDGKIDPNELIQMLEKYL